MARSLQVISLLSRLGAPPLCPTASLNACRLASRVASQARMGQARVTKGGTPASRHSVEISNEQFELEDVEDKLQALVDVGRKRQRAIKYHILRRKMTPPGAPERKLTWDAMEQIRYLKQEQPEEWTVERLAEGFSVTPEVILRILRSKFVPKPERKAKQDAKVMPRQTLPLAAGTAQGRLQLPGNLTPAALPAGSRGGAVARVSEQTVMLPARGPEAPAAVTVVQTQIIASINKDAPVTKSTNEDGTNDTNSAEEESWDGRGLTDEEVEELMDVEKSPVVQVGKDFLDAEGNFLYRI